MKRLILLILFIIPNLLATTYKDSGLYGSLALSYLSNGYNSARSKNSQNDFMQEYKMGYRGNIYSPKFLNYSLMGILRYEDINSKVNDGTSKTKVESQDYNANFNFIQGSKMPFRIYARKSDRPTSVVYSAGALKSLNNSEAMGVSGSINFNIFDFTYSVANTDTKYESILSSEDRNTKSYKSSIRKRDENYNFQLDYSNINDIYQREYTDQNKTTTTVTNTKSTENNINLVYRWDISDELLFNTYSYYRDKVFSGSEYYSSATTSAAANLNWVPKTKHTASLSLDAFNIEDTFNSTKSVSVRQSYGYKITKNLNLSQQSGYNIVTSDGSSTQTMNLGSTLSYRKDISKDTRMNLSAGANIISNTSDSNTSTDTNRYTYYGRVGVGHNMGYINSRLNINMGYNGSRSTSGEMNERYNVDLSVMSILFSLIRNNLTTSYYKEKAKLMYDYTLLNREITRMSVDDYISNTSRVGINGWITTKLGVSYSSIENGVIKTERLNPKGDLNFKYKLGPKLLFISDMHVDKDLIYDMTTYRSNNSLAFNSRKTKISLGYNYNKIVSGKNSDMASMDSYALQVRFERNF